MALCLEQGADLHMAQLMPLPLTVSCFSKSRLVLPFWYWLTQVVPEKGPLNGCVCVCWTFTIRYDTRCYFNVRSKADISQLNLPHGTDN